MMKSYRTGGKPGRRWFAVLAVMGALFSSSAGANGEQPLPTQAGSLAVSHQLPRRVICRTGPNLQLSISGRALVLTGFVTEKNIVAKSFTELKPGSCAGMVHPENNTGTTSAPNYTKFGPQKNGPLRLRMGILQNIVFEITAGRLIALKTAPTGSSTNTQQDEDKRLDAIRSWVQARDGEIEFTAAHDTPPESFQIESSIIVRSLTK